MEKQNAMSKALVAIETIIQYWNDHAAARNALNKVYAREWKEEDPEGNYSKQLLINPDGNLYKVTQRYFVNGKFFREESFLATYAWQSNGHLIGVGNYRFLIIDPLKKVVYLEDNPDSRSFTLEEFHEVKY